MGMVSYSFKVGYLFGCLLGREILFCIQKNGFRISGLCLLRVWALRYFSHAHCTLGYTGPPS